MELTHIPHFSQNINPHLTQIQYGWPMRRRPVICACVKMTSLWEFLKAPILFCFMQVVSENHLTLFRPTEFSIKFDTVMSGWSIVYIGGSQVYNLKKSEINL